MSERISCWLLMRPSRRCDPRREGPVGDTLSSAQRKVLSALASANGHMLDRRDLPASTVRWLEAQGLVVVRYTGTETRCPRSGVMVHTAGPTLVQLTDAGRDAAR